MPDIPSELVDAGLTDGASDDRRVPAITVRLSPDQHSAIRESAARSRKSSLQAWASRVLETAAALEHEVHFWRQAAARKLAVAEEPDANSVADAWFEALKATGALADPCPPERAVQVRAIGQHVVQLILDYHRFGSERDSTG